VRIRELDGLRGIAILVVLYAHYLAWLPAPGTAYGGLGVELFFVISGFLITSILLGLRERDHYFTIFYSRRALRILPPYYLALAIYIAVSLALRLPGAWSFWSRFVFFYSSLCVQGPFSLAGKPVNIPAIVFQSMGVLWSLSVEEIYYILWAPVVRFSKKKGLIGILIAAVVAGPLSRWWLGGNATRSFYWHLDGLAYGSAVALLIHHRQPSSTMWRKADRVLNWLIVVLIPAAVAFSLISRGSPDSALAPLGITLADMSFALVAYALICNSGSNLLWVRIFRTKWLRSIGMVSYSLYLFHGPILLACNHLISRSHLVKQAYVGLYAALLGLVISFSVAYGLWYGMESRILRWKDRKVPSPAHPSDALVESVESPQPASVS
jgi:peptidoglycan/LPS O-acetylase OafA/YrhL